MKKNGCEKHVEVYVVKKKNRERTRYNWDKLKESNFFKITKVSLEHESLSVIFSSMILKEKKLLSNYIL